MAHGTDAKTKHFKDGTIDFISGSLGGIALVYVGQPLDTIKVKMQTFPNMYPNMWHCFKKTLAVDGIARGLYAGTVPALASNVAENSVLFLAYGFCQKVMVKLTNSRDVTELSALSNAWAGFFGAFFSSIAMCPTELVKCKLQAMYEKNKQEAAIGKLFKRVGPSKLVSIIFKREGIPGFFKGFVPTVVREMPGYFFFFGGYEATRELLRKPGQSKENIGLWRTMVAGGVGGIIFWTVTFPADVVKSRIQVNSSQENMMLLMGKIARQEGVAALYTGLAPTLLRTIPATATLFATYEYSKKFMHYITDNV